MAHSENVVTPTTVAVVQEPLELYYPFLSNESLIVRAQTPPLVQAYLRWQYVRRGGLDGYTQLDFAPTGWEGYVVGMPAEQQQESLQTLGLEMLQRLQFVGHQAGVPADRLLAEIAEEKFTQRTAHLLEPIFFSALQHMRAVGQNGLAVRAYSSWRTAYEQELSQLERTLQTTQSPTERHQLINQIAAKQWTLQQKLAELTHGRLAAAARYEEVHQRVAARVATLVQTVDAPLAVDLSAACVRYLLPATPTINTAPEERLTANAPEWYIPLRNLPLIGHPLIRAAMTAA